MDIFVKTKESKFKLSMEEFREWLIKFLDAPLSIQRAIQLMSDRNLIAAARKHSKMTKDFKLYVRGKRELLVK